MQSRSSEWHCLFTQCDWSLSFCSKGVEPANWLADRNTSCELSITAVEIKATASCAEPDIIQNDRPEVSGLSN